MITNGSEYKIFFLQIDFECFIDITNLFNATGVVISRIRVSIVVYIYTYMKKKMKENVWRVVVWQP